MEAIKWLKDLPFNTRLFLVLALVITLLCGLVYISAQQIYRQSANDPQIQLSEDMANYLSAGGDIQTVLPKPEVDISKSLVWFVIVYDDSGEVVSSNAKLDDQTPKLPGGLLDYPKKNGQHRITWEPKKGVRVASVITRYDKGYVLAGRSLRESENRVMMMGKKVLLAWVVIIAAAFLGTHLLIPKKLH